MVQMGLIGSIHFFFGKGVALTSACFKVHSTQNVSQMYCKDVSMLLWKPEIFAWTM